ncbi:MAG: sigma 54-interacting transcriptional regulator [Planctomycetes bacterium]|nr:sigma 54-interacting transcriptional regulator [Planctomycetota bacterium]
MGFFRTEERAQAEAIRGLIDGNPFLPERIAHERVLLGGAFRAEGADWNLHPERADDHPNLVLLGERVEALVEAGAARLRGGERPGAEDLELYRDAVLYLVYHHRRGDFARVVEGAGGRRQVATLWADFNADLDRWLGPLPGARPSPGEAAHLFACLFQIRRAFLQTFLCIVGRSRPAARLRAAVWESVFTHDLRRYWSGLHARMADFTTLVLGPTGTGKELVAGAIARSRYIPFDPRTRAFTRDFEDLFLPLNLEAMPGTLVESELFGHRRGAFTGAVEDRAGWLEACPAEGTVFLDEIGELGAAVQVKLLRVLQERTFTRLGESRARRFEGKILAATNRAPADLLRRGRLREDFYYRLCSDVVTVPSLRERLDDDPGELEELVRHFLRRLLGEAGTEAAAGATAWIGSHLGAGYGWPGNVRELEQCVRNVLVRGSYRPPPAVGEAGAGDPFEETVRAARAGELTAEELLRRYCRWVHGRTGSYVETARRLGLDRRTVKAKLKG